MDEVRAAIERTLQLSASSRLPAERLAEVTSRLRYGFLSGLETPDQVAATVCHYAQLTGTPSAIDRSFATLDGVTADDVARAAARVFGPANRTVVTLAPSVAGDPV
jgi:zinc protease